MKKAINNTKVSINNETRNSETKGEKAMRYTTKLYTNAAVENLIGQYLEKGGEVIELNDEGISQTVCTARGYKTTVITKTANTELGAEHKVRMYNRTPEKYEQMLREYRKGDRWGKEYIGLTMVPLK